MKKINFNKILNSSVVKNAITFTSDNLPTILMFLAAGGTVLTVGLTVKATAKSCNDISAKEKEKSYADEDPLTTEEKLVLCWRNYIPVVLTAGATIGCTIGANAVNLKRSTALLAAYELSQKALSEYKSASEELLSPEENKKLIDKVAEKRIESDPDIQGASSTSKSSEDVKCYDYYSGRYFWSNVNKIKSAENSINRQIIYDQYASLNDLYDYLGISPNGDGDILGWGIDDGHIEIEVSTIMSENNEPAIVVQPKVYPHFNFGDN